jgi:hypothetical protein
MSIPANPLDWQKHFEEMQLTDEQSAIWDKAVEVAKPFMLEMIRLGQEMKEKIEEEVPDFDSDWDELGMFYSPVSEENTVDFWTDK